MTTRPCIANHPVAIEWAHACHLCRLATSDPRYRAWADPDRPGVVPLPVVCPHRGAATGERRECPSCSGTVKVPLLACGVFGACSDSISVSGVACCKTCELHPRRAYTYATPARAGDPWKTPVIVPTPPAFTPRTASRRAVVTVAAGDKGRALLAVSGPLLRAYAARVGAEYVVSTWAGSPAWPMSSKFAIGPIAAAFDEVLYADADVLLLPTTLDLFALRRDPRAVLAYNDLPHLLQHAPEMAAEYQRLREAQKLPRAPLPWYLNTGLVVMSRCHAPHIAPPSHPMPPLHCAEQHLWNARLYESGYPIEFMADDQHYQWWIQQTMRGAPPWAALHFSGMGDDARRLDEMRRVAGGAA